MKKIVLFVLLDQWADWEAAYLTSAISMLGQNEYEVKTVSLTKESVQSIGGVKAVPDYEISAVPSNYEGVILIGGYSWRSQEAKKVTNLIEECLDNKKVLGAICDSVGFLGRSGILNNVKHTSNHLSDLKQQSGVAYIGEHKYINEQAVRDGNLVTANGTATLEFAKEVMNALNVASSEKIKEWYSFHKTGLYETEMALV